MDVLIGVQPEGVGLYTHIGNAKVCDGHPHPPARPPPSPPPTPTPPHTPPHPAHPPAPAVACAHASSLSTHATASRSFPTQILRVFLKFSELASWTINPLWNGQEAPDYSVSSLAPDELEKHDYPLGPYRSDFYLHTKVQRAKARGPAAPVSIRAGSADVAMHARGGSGGLQEVEFELSSFLSEDDTLVSALEHYNVAFQMFAQFMELDGTHARRFAVGPILAASSPDRWGTERDMP